MCRPAALSMQADEALEVRHGEVVLFFIRIVVGEESDGVFVFGVAVDVFFEDGDELVPAFGTAECGTVTLTIILVFRVVLDEGVSGGDGVIPIAFVDECCVGSEEDVGFFRVPGVEIGEQRVGIFGVAEGLVRVKEGKPDGKGGRLLFEGGNDGVEDGGRGDGG